MSHPLCLLSRLIDQEKAIDSYLFCLFTSQSKERVVDLTRSFDLVLNSGLWVMSIVIFYAVLLTPDSGLITD